MLWQRPTDRHVFGYTYDKLDRDRADRLRANYPEMVILTPLIERQITKASCLSMVASAGIKLPPMYAMGFQNNNCIPCVKATSPSYWNKVRRDFPDVFARRAAQSRELGCRLARLKGERIFLDELPPEETEWVQEDLSCGPQCTFAET